MLKYGSLFSGTGGLDLGVQSVLGGETAWFCEFDKAPSKILAHHWPDVPNLGDITKVDWTQVEPVDVLTGGYPCQPFSHAGKRAGVGDDRHLWPYVAQAIAGMRPGLCVFENVRGHLSLGFDEVLRDLQQLGYSVTWYLLRAADIGAAHGRARLFIFAEDSNEHRVCGRTHRRRGMDRNHEPIAGGHLRDQPQGQHVGQGEARVGCTGGPIRGQGHCGCGCDGHSPQHLPVAVDREGCCGGAQGAGGASDYQGEAVPDRPGACGDGRGCPDRQGRWQEVEPGDERACSDAAVAHQGGESARPGPDSANPAELEADSGLQPRMVVGAGRRPIRPGGVRGPAAGVRSDGCWACVRDALMERAAGFGVDPAAVGEPLTLLPTPACNDMGASYTPETWDAWTAKMQAAHGNGNGHGKSLSIEAQRLLPTPVSDNSRGLPSSGTDYASLPNAVVNLLPTPNASLVGPHGERGPRTLDSRKGKQVELPDVVAHARWGDYAAAIARWEHVIGRPAPDPTETGAKGNPRLSPRFCEWLMGLPAGHVTDTGITRNEQLKALGNGVVPAQSAAATRAWVEDTYQEARTA